MHSTYYVAKKEEEMCEAVYKTKEGRALIESMYRNTLAQFSSLLCHCSPQAVLYR